MIDKFKQFKKRWASETNHYSIWTSCSLYSLLQTVIPVIKSSGSLQWNQAIMNQIPITYWIHISGSLQFCIILYCSGLDIQHRFRGSCCRNIFWCTMFQFRSFMEIFIEESVFWKLCNALLCNKHTDPLLLSIATVPLCTLSENSKCCLLKTTSQKGCSVLIGQLWHGRCWPNTR